MSQNGNKQTRTYIIDHRLHARLLYWFYSTNILSFCQIFVERYDDPVVHSNLSNPDNDHHRRQTS